MRSAFAFLLALSAAASFAAPPTIVIPDAKPVSGYVRFTPQTDAKAVVYIARDEAYPFPSEELKDARRFILPVTGLKDGSYRFFAVASLNDEMTVVEFTVVIGKATTPPPTKPPDGTDPVPVPVTKGYFLIVRPDGPASPDFAAVLANPAWDELRKAGHVVKEKTLTETVPIYKPPAGTTLPFVVTLSQTSPSKVLAGPVELPTTADGIRELAKGVK